MTSQVPLTVLNVSSDKNALYFSSRVLRDAGFRTIEAGSMREAIVLARQRPDLIVIDTRLEKVLRCDLCRIAQSGAAPSIPVLHLVSSLDEIIFDADCPINLRCGNLRWPASASVMLATVRTLLDATLPAPGVGDSVRHLVDRLVHTASYQVDAQGTVLDWDASAEHLFGWTAREVLGRFLPIVDEANRDEFLRVLDSAFRGQPLYRWETDRRAKDGRSIPVAVSMMPITDAGGAITRVQIVAADISEFKFLQDDLRRISSIIIASGDFVCVLDKTGRLEFINPAGRQLIGFDPGFAPSELSLRRILSPSSYDRLLQFDLPRAAAESTFLDELSFIAADGTEVPASVQIIRLGPLGSDCFALVARNIRAQKITEARLLRLNRTHQVLLKCNQAIQMARDETDLFASICQLLTDTGGYRFVLLSLIVHDPEQKMQPAAWSGDDTLSAADLVVYWDAERERSDGPTGSAVRTGQMVIRHDLDTRAYRMPWKENIRRLGLRSMVALPLLQGAQCFGALSIYTDQLSVFDFDDEVSLLQELARQVAHGIHALRVEVARHAAEADLRLFAGAIESTQDGVMITDALRPEHPIVYVNPAFTRITGWEAEEVLGRNGRFLVAEELQQPGMDSIRHALRERTAGQAGLRCFRKDGQVFWNELHVAPISDAAQNVTHFVSILSDISERIQHENELAHLAMHDPLTGLANRTLLNDRLQQAMVRAQRDGRLVAVLLIDLDRFKLINDTLGHGTGDTMLLMVGHRLQQFVLEGETVARLGGDEFVILLSDLESELDVPRTGQMLLEHLATPFDIGTEQISLTLSIGASIYPRDASDAESLLRLADMAMYEVKESGRNDFRCFSPEMGLRSHSQLVLEKDLRYALERGELLLHYQPKADLYSGNIHGVEALLRWQHPDLGLVSPAQFIPLAEASGLIVPIGGWVLREACRQARQWQQDGLPPLRVAVNLSVLQFRQPDLVEQVARVLVETGLEPCWLELEVTESLVMNNPEIAADFLKRLKRMGIRLAMDDFGTGYSSLGYLRRFPFDVLKIDRSFVQNIVSEPDDALIAVAVIAMAHSLGLQVIAEGVESESQMRYLRSHLCDEIQGYLFSPPLPAAELASFLRNPPSLALGAAGGERPERTLLLVDDEPDILNSLKRLLRRGGYRILTAGSAAEGLELLARNDVRVIVSDQRMPAMSGSEFLGRVKTLYPDSVRIILSGYADLAALTDAINRGAIYKFITKPWDDEEFREVIREAFVAHERKSGKTEDDNPPGEAT